MARSSVSSGFQVSPLRWMLARRNCHENHSNKLDNENVIAGMNDSTSDQALCPVARAESIVGDRWTVLILRELFMRMHRFEEIQAQTGGTPQMIAARLKKLETDGLVKRRVYKQDLGAEQAPKYRSERQTRWAAFRASR